MEFEKFKQLITEEGLNSAELKPLLDELKVVSNEDLISVDLKTFKKHFDRAFKEHKITNVRIYRTTVTASIYESAHFCPTIGFGSLRHPVDDNTKIVLLPLIKERAWEDILFKYPFLKDYLWDALKEKYIGRKSSKIIKDANLKIKQIDKQLEILSDQKYTNKLRAKLEKQKQDLQNSLTTYMQEVGGRAQLRQTISSQDDATIWNDKL